MSYFFAEERPYVFTDEGSRAVLRVFREAQTLTKLSGVVRLDKLMLTCGSGDSFKHLAVIDRCVELNLIREVPTTNRATQHKIYELVGE